MKTINILPRKILESTSNIVLYLLIISSILLAKNSFAQTPDGVVLAEYDFEINTSYTYVDQEVNASDVNLHGIPQNGLNQGFCSLKYYEGDEWNTLIVQDTSQYYEFTIAPSSGKRLQLIRLSFDATRHPMGPQYGQIRSSLDNFTDPISPFPGPNNTSFTYDTICNQIIIHLSAMANTFNNLKEPITFRIYGFESIGMGNANKLAIDNLQIFGKVVPGNPLPITLVDFDAKPAKDKVLLNWITATESNNDYFTLERSDNNNEFVPVAQVKGAGNSTETQHYEYVDPVSAKGMVYYRLKQTDFDGKFAYSPVVAVKVGDVGYNIKMYPNPAISEINVEVSDLAEGIYNVEVFDLTGKQLKFEKIYLEQNMNLINIPVSDLQEGNYVIRITDGTNTVTDRFVKS